MCRRFGFWPFCFPFGNFILNRRKRVGILSGFLASFFVPALVLLSENLARVCGIYSKIYSNVDDNNTVSIMSWIFSESSSGFFSLVNS